MLRGLVLLPAQAQITAVGGKGAEFLVDGKNYDEGGNIGQMIDGERETTYLTVLAPSLGSNADTPKARLLRNGDQIGCELISPHRPPMQLWFRGDRVDVQLLPSNP